MPLITPIDARGARKYDFRYDRHLGFEAPDEFDLIQLAARARIASRRAYGDQPFANDEYIAGLHRPFCVDKGVYTNREWLEQCDVMLHDYVMRGYEYVPPPLAADKQRLRDKVAEFAQELRIVSRIFDESRDLAFLELYANDGQWPAA